MLSLSIAQNDPDFVLLSEISDKDRPWDRHKRNSLRIAHSLQLGNLDRLSERILDCAKYLEFCYVSSRNELELELKLFNTRFCRVRLCPICNWRRTLRWQARLRNALPALLNDYPNTAFILLTLTVKNCELKSLKDELKLLNKAWKRLTERKNFPALGFLKSLEITRANDDSCHPHIHAVLIVRKSYFSKGYLSQAKWCELWKSCARLDYSPIVDVRRIKPKKSFQGDYCEGILEALREVTKYSIKAQDLMTASPAWLAELAHQIHKTRSVAVGGILKEYLSEDEPEDLIGESEDPTNEPKTGDLIFGYKKRLQAYTMIDKQPLSMDE